MLSERLGVRQLYERRERGSSLKLLFKQLQSAQAAAGEKDHGEPQNRDVTGLGHISQRHGLIGDYGTGGAIANRRFLFFHDGIGLVAPPRELALPVFLAIGPSIKSVKPQ